MASATSLLVSSPAATFLDRRRSRGAPAAATVSFLRRGGGRRTARAVAAGMKRYKGTAMREEKLAEMIEKKVAEAMEICGGGGGDGEAADRDSDGCRVAWDEVEEVSQAKADLRRRIAEAAADPLERYCRDHPDADECRVCDE